MGQRWFHAQWVRDGAWGVLITIFSFFGAEIVTIAADETANPKDKIRRATNLVVYRIAIFYLASIFLVVSLVAWNDPGLKAVGRSSVYWKC